MNTLDSDTLALLGYLAGVDATHLERAQIAEGMGWEIDRVNAAIGGATIHEIDDVAPSMEGPVGITVRGREVAAQGRR